MKERVIKETLLCFVMLVTTIGLQAQVNDLKNLDPQKKGNIKLLDGTEMSYKNLNVLGDTIYFESNTGTRQQVSGSEVYRVTKTGNYAAVYGFSCAAGGLLGGVVGTMNWNGTSLEDKRTGFIIGGTLVCGAVGAIVGALVKKETTVYKNAEFNYSFNLIRNNVVDEKYYAIGITVKLNHKN
ncbi:MAG: hypothetical protein GXO88_10510 [Chlorobi bacterium]|nr:hypothetical protein [Chlorobiota bacterium]